MNSPLLYRDRDVAKLIGMSSSWVRGQRHLRRHGKEHVLALDPVLIGSTPLYPADELLKWVAEVKAR
ncbi:hypothetical protein LJR219_000199 [Phenylobacterium sp. LjRoot219]|uniref:hypothetical protein n=1 Tax=Phenylobacterium sp. LjRoot219 TaxID=3342283 RepID=UPI003ECE4A14